MRNTATLFLLSFLLLGSTANAQLNKAEKSFLNYFFKDFRKNKGPILYLKDHDYRNLTQLLKPDTLFDMWALAGRNKPQNKLILTEKERKYIFTQLRKFRSIDWKDHLLDDASLLSRDTVNYYMKDIAYGWQKLYDRGIYGFYNFSNPIFLRNETLCIFQFDFSCGNLCGQGTIMIYRKENRIWKPYINLANWIS